MSDPLEPPPGKSSALILGDDPTRVKLRELQGSLGQVRDRIADLDLEIESLRTELVEFEGTLHARLAAEYGALDRVDSYVRYQERWADLLARAAKTDATLGSQAAQVEEKRAAEVRKRDVPREPRETEAPDSDPDQLRDVLPGGPRASASPGPADRETRLKTAFRALARRFHPDLARTEEERLQFGAMMGRINDLYRLGDLDRLAALAEQAKGGEIDDPDLEPDEQVAILEDRLAWFNMVLANLRQERQELESCSTCELARSVEQAAAAGRDLFEEMRVELKERVEGAYKDVAEAARWLEQEVARFNRDQKDGLTRAGKNAELAKTFSPFADRGLVRVGLETLARERLSGQARRLSTWIEEEVEQNPGLVRLLLFTHASSLSPFPLEGLESFDDLRERFRVLAADDPESPGLEATLVHAEDLVEYGVRAGEDGVVRTGLRFRNDDVRAAVAVSLDGFRVRRLFRGVLGLLSRGARCEGCSQDVYPVPLYRLRGVDNLRATVCPSCGFTLSSYWLPKGQDVQAVLNRTFLDFDMVSEWSFSLGRGDIAIQLAPSQRDHMTVGDLKRRFVDDVFQRNGIEITRGQVRLLQGGRRVTEKIPLDVLTEQGFRVGLTEAVERSEDEIFELIRHRVRTRFR